VRLGNEGTGRHDGSFDKLRTGSDRRYNCNCTAARDSGGYLRTIASEIFL
jgi:hypothetical protein